MTNDWLKSAIVSYLQTHKHVDTIELVSYFKLRADITLTALYELYDTKVEQYWTGREYILRLK